MKIIKQFCKVILPDFTPTSYAWKIPEHNICLMFLTFLKSDLYVAFPWWLIMLSISEDLFQIYLCVCVCATWMCSQMSEDVVGSSGARVRGWCELLDMVARNHIEVFWKGSECSYPHLSRSNIEHFSGLIKPLIFLNLVSVTINVSFIL